MASINTGPSLEEELTCSVCREIFRDPITLQCGHNFCRDCVSRYWKQKRSHACPLCRELCSVNELKTNHTLSNIAESFLKDQEQKSKDSRELLCNQHNEKLKLFCLEDQEAICVICQTSIKHENHKCRPIQEVAENYKEELRSTLKAFQNNMTNLTRIKEQYGKCLQHISEQEAQTEKEIQDQLGKLHQFLYSEEESLLADLRKEKEKKMQKMEEDIKKITEDITCLSGAISVTKQELNTDDTLFLKNIKSTRKRATCTISEPLLTPGSLIDTAKYLENLKYHVWKKMLTIIKAVPVTLDPNTASPFLLLSEDLTTISHSPSVMQLPDNQERFNLCACVLGSNGFRYGKHTWEVDVGCKPEWDVGVARDSICRKGKITLSPEKGFWAIALRNGEEYYGCTSRWTPLTLQSKPRKIKVSLDYEKGKLSFYNAEDMTHIFTFIERFTERLCPYFFQGVNEGDTKSEPLRICPLKITVTKE
ncbi:zinc-binding protein A33-like [Protopterus annectens]|uniref:zinc-binding protein A33-like n=1 Tax=Protopterus annectens TaxID=7888 RepID=UPI001CFBC213|nr:zinc-binding protein A33-like [Protopterus annectens]XP_043917813.1 zinc-binding protein A33-like [Protopterus annectens]XP_043917814.1 zinc-binding protein A33-like [Protopterus annectens]XP_043917815.1 zinc-binding protein A33-like [Protopterus annectens]XP_043917817.1 zinc-binding protein A33-like [Protopterus annectens]